MDFQGMQSSSLKDIVCTVEIYPKVYFMSSRWGFPCLVCFSPQKVNVYTPIYYNDTYDSEGALYFHIVLLTLPCIAALHHFSFPTLSSATTEQHKERDPWTRESGEVTMWLGESNEPPRMVAYHIRKKSH